LPPSSASRNNDRIDFMMSSKSAPRIGKVVILAGGLGSRLNEETEVRPKPMIEIGGRPMIWHIMKIYSAFGFADFVICLGYKGYMIKEFFLNYHVHMADVTVDLSSNATTIHHKRAEPWKVTLVETGETTMTGGRVRRIREYVEDETFCLTYGDGVADIDLKALIASHYAHGRAATLTAVQPPGRFGALETDSAGVVRWFREKPAGDGGWINGGFLVLSPQVFDYIDGDDTVFEEEPLNRLSAEGKLSAYRHSGFWLAMDTPRDKRQLEALWNSGRAPWKVW
jgi:glucose-1-phosphate cytidylyltransferase